MAAAGQGVRAGEGGVTEGTEEGPVQGGEGRGHGGRGLGRGREGHPRGA